MARPRAADHDDQRAAILACAAGLFAARGYHGTSMNDVAQAAGIGKATLYHYVRDKPALVEQIARSHVATLLALVGEVRSMKLEPEPHLRTLLTRFTSVYAGAQAAHRVLTEDVKFLPPESADAVRAHEREVVAEFARSIAQLRPDLRARATPLAMLLLGMINWTFTWLKPGGTLTHEALAPMVADLFFGGLPAVATPART
jgi:AcrR family transcriptional regulator